MLKTEMRNPKTTHIDQMSALEIAKVMNEENAYCVQAVEAELPQVAKAIDAITEALEKGGRLFYVGAGTSGRLGIVDAAECPPTYGVPSDMVIALMAGGLPAVVNASENREDDPEASVAELKEKNLTGKDVVVGISAAGGAAYVLNAMRYGTVPVVHATGGLKDTVPPCDENGEGGLGFTFQSYNADDFYAAVKRALDLYNDNREAFRALQKKEMEMDFSWDVPAGKYMELFKNMLSW